MNGQLIVLDRDGVINVDSDDYIKTVEEWIAIPGSMAGISLLSRAGFTVAVATNQSGIGRGYFDEYTLARMHEKMHTLAEAQGGRIAAVFYCPHLPDAGCACRKPGVGLLEQIEAEFNVSLAGSWYVGDSEKDIDCALARGCRPVLVLTGKGGATWRNLAPEKRAQVRVFDDLFAAANYILDAGN